MQNIIVFPTNISQNTVFSRDIIDFFKTWLRPCVCIGNNHTVMALIMSESATNVSLGLEETKLLLSEYGEKLEGQVKRRYSIC